MKRRVSINTGTPVPQAQICINKSRLKVYNKDTEPTYYLQKGQEFQIELFNPTSDTVLAKIHLNGKAISQGGLILKPGQRVFLERYLDVAKKFMFDTYEVSNTEEVKKAIEDNGDFKVEFYRETQIVPSWGSTTLITTTQNPTWTYKQYPFTYTSGYNNVTFNTSNSTVAGSYFNYNATTTNATMDSYSSLEPPTLRKKSKTIETGRVEAGSDSNQSFEYVNQTFDTYAFHTVEYKLLPVSQKINTVADVNVKQYCTNCGAKQKPEWKFCPSCGKKC